MDPKIKSALSEAHPETMDFLSKAWCNFAVQTLQPDLQDQSIVILDNSLQKFNCDDMKSPTFSKMEKSAKMDNTEFKPLPPWKSNDVKSWIWMQQAMHPELNYNSCFRKKWFPWKIVPIKSISIKKWFKNIKQKRKEEDRLQRAQVHAALSVAGVAAALAAIAAENSKKDGLGPTKEAAVASAAALVAAQCARVAEAMGARKGQLDGVIGSATSGTSASDILTLTAAASTSIRGAATLEARRGCKKKAKGNVPILPIEDTNNNNNIDFNFHKCRSILAKGTQLHVETPDGNFRVRSVSIILNNESKVILKIKKLNLLKSNMESIVMDMHAELYKESSSSEAAHQKSGGEEEEDHTCYLIVLSTNQGMIKLDMGDDHHLYETWATTIHHMLMLYSSFSTYQLHFYNN